MALSLHACHYCRVEFIPGDLAILGYPSNDFSPSQFAHKQCWDNRGRTSPERPVHWHTIMRDASQLRFRVDDLEAKLKHDREMRGVGRFILAYAVMMSTLLAGIITWGVCR